MHHPYEGLRKTVLLYWCTPCSEKKPVGPTTTLTFLGMEIDTIQMVVKYHKIK